MFWYNSFELEPDEDEKMKSIRKELLSKLFLVIFALLVFIGSSFLKAMSWGDNFSRKLLNWFSIKKEVKEGLIAP